MKSFLFFLPPFFFFFFLFLLFSFMSAPRVNSYVHSWYLVEVVELQSLLYKGKWVGSLSSSWLPAEICRSSVSLSLIWFCHIWLKLAIGCRSHWGNGQGDRFANKFTQTSTQRNGRAFPCTTHLRKSSSDGHFSLVSSNFCHLSLRMEELLTWESNKWAA